ncbi:MAG: hypothetical protein B7733_05235 [Myxococcales bacterium FL481]|nr:MAG: hypothetical protein B7733_05235 [Myxococcales bacterium FL481]
MRLRAVTYNIHKCIGGLDRRYQPQRVVDVLAHYEPDIVMLQEVDYGAKRSQRHAQVDLVGDALGLRHRVFYSNVGARGGGGYGNAILARFPLTREENVDLKIGWRKQRSALHCRCRVRAGPGRKTRSVHLFNLHLGLAESERGQQLKRFLDSRPFARLHRRTPVIMAGDFNDVWGSLGARYLQPAGFLGVRRAVRTFPAYAPLRALDSFYARGDVNVRQVFRSALQLAKSASDHLPLIADLEIRS